MLVPQLLGFGWSFIPFCGMHSLGSSALSHFWLRLGLCCGFCSGVWFVSNLRLLWFCLWLLRLCFRFSCARAYLVFFLFLDLAKFIRLVILVFL